METVKEHLYSYVKKMLTITDKEIDELVIGDYFDSLDLIDLIFDIEKEYDIEVDEKIVDKLPDMRLSELIEYVKSKLDLK
jgi:acyl carrier protein